MNAGYEWGGGPDLSAWESVMWRSSADPRVAASGITMEILDREPGWDRFLYAHDRGSRAVPRMRDRIVDPVLPVVAAAWSPDPNFDIEHHVYRMHLPPPGTREDLHDLVATVLRRPLDRHRPPWEVVLVTGLEGGKAAYLLKTHHVLADGLGLVQLLELVHSRTRRPGPRGSASPPARREQSPAGLLVSRVGGQALGVAGGAVDGVRTLTGVVTSRVLRPWRLATDALDYVRSAQEILGPMAAERSPLLRESLGGGSRVLTLDMPFTDLRAAARAAEGTINDAYIAGVVGGLRRYHERNGVQIEELPVAIPISTRTAQDPIGGNHFTSIRFTAPMNEPDPAECVRQIRARIVRGRGQPALNIVEQLAPYMNVLPMATLADLIVGTTTTCDVQMTNIPGVRHTTYVAGAKVVEAYAIGPRPGVAIMAGLTTYEGRAFLGFHIDPDVFTDIEMLQECLREGFDEVLALRPRESQETQETTRTPAAPRTATKTAKTTAKGAKRARTAKATKAAQPTTTSQPTGTTETVQPTEGTP